MPRRHRAPFYLRGNPIPAAGDHRSACFLAQGRGTLERDLAAFPFCQDSGHPQVFGTRDDKPRRTAWLDGRFWWTLTSQLT